MFRNFFHRNSFSKEFAKKFQQFFFQKNKFSKKTFIKVSKLCFQQKYILKKISTNSQKNIQKQYYSTKFQEIFKIFLKRNIFFRKIY